jgi:phosphatidylserine decarboxylase
MNPASADRNEQNVVTVRGVGGVEVTFKQIAGLLARRIVFNCKQGDSVERGQRVGLIKFGSRVDVLLPPEARILVKVGERVKGASSVLAALPEAVIVLAEPAVETIETVGILPEPALGELK